LFNATVFEYSVDNPTLGVTAPLKSTVVKSVGGAGTAYLKQKLGPGGQAWHANTVSYAVQYAISGATKNMRARIYSLRSQPMEAEVRSAYRLAGELVGDPPREFPIPRFPFKLCGKPPKARKPPAGTPGAPPAFLDELNFESTGLSGGFAAVQTVSGTVQQRETGAALKNSWGYRFQKTAATSAINCAYKQYTPTSRTAISERFLFRADSLPSRSWATLLGVKNGAVTPSSSSPTSSDMGKLVLELDGTLTLIGTNESGSTRTLKTAAKLVAGEIVDIEVFFKGGDTQTQGKIELWLGRGNSVRTKVAELTGLDWENRHPRTVVYGPYALGDPATLYNFSTDHWMVADNGAPTTTDPGTPPLEPLPLTDYPKSPGALLRAIQDFNSGVAPGTLGTPGAGSFTLARSTTSPISGTHSLLVADADATSGSSGLYYEEAFPTDRSSAGVRWQIREDTRPASGEFVVFDLTNVSGSVYARLYLDSVGDVYAEALDPAGARPRQQVADDVLVGEVVTVEVTAAGAGTTNGSVAVYVTRVGGARQWLGDFSGLDWSGGLLDRYRVGGWSPTVATTTYQVVIDNINLTENGEYEYLQFSEGGVEVEQAYLLLHPGQPKMQTLYLRGGRRAVVPGEFYDFAIWARWSGIPTTDRALPFFIVAYDSKGQKHDLGCLCDNPNYEGGATGTQDWIDLWLENVEIPEECYEVQWECRDMIEGEYVAQMPGMRRRTEELDTTSFSREVSYPLTASFSCTLDTLTPRHAAWLAPLDRFWRYFASRVTPAPGCSVTEEFWSSELQTGPFNPRQTEPSLVTPARYAHYEATFTTDGVHRPVLVSGYPRVDYKLAVDDTLLHADGSELPGGVVLGGVQPWFDRERASVVELDTGRVIIQSGGTLVGYLAGVAVQCFTEETAAILQGRWQHERWIIETPTERLLVKPVGELELERAEGGYWNVGGYEYGWFEGDFDGYFEVLEAVPTTPLAA
jgi:hypothetical protein